MVTYEPSCGFFFQNSSILNAPWGRQATVHPYPRQLPFIYSLSSNLRASVFWKRWWLFWKRESYLRLLVDSTYLKVRQIVLRNAISEDFLEETHTLLKSSRTLLTPIILYFKEKEKSKPTVSIFHIKTVTQRCSASKAALTSWCSPSDGQNLVPTAKTKLSGQPPVLESSANI